LKKKKVKLKEQDVNKIIQLFDLVVKAHGLKYAKLAVIYTEKIQETFSK